MDDGECMPKPTSIRPVLDDGGEDSVEDPNLLVEIDPCAKKSKKECKKAKVCRYKRTKDICKSRRPKKDVVAGDVDHKGINNIPTDPTKTKPCPANQCPSPDGGCVPLVNCLINPCEMNPCSATEICIPNYCGGCNHVCLPRQSDPRPIAIGDSEPFQLPEGACLVGGEDCPDDLFCRLETGVCLVEIDFQIGMCAVKSEFCTNMMYAPVCGCDGETYTNSCTADSAGVSISSTGECIDNKAIGINATDTVDTGTPASNEPEVCVVGNGDCAAGSFCRLEPETCLAEPDVHMGMCAVKSHKCEEMYAPVCGCDGRTYGNACFADTHGVSISRRGKCIDNEPIQADEQTNDPVSCAVGSASATTGLNMDPCPTDTFCKLDTGACLTKSAVLFGLCAPRSEHCNMMYDPVCGCNDKTYGNSCIAETAGVSISRRGDCTKPDMTIIKDASQGDLSTDPSFEVLDTDPIIEVLKCGSQGKCSEAGTTCTVGTETCCGVTHDSMECTCESGDDGRLQYQCKYTDRCMFPSCCQSGPPADMPPHAYGTCAIGELCDTGIADDYCCYDELGGTGSYCSKSGGKATINEPRSAPSTPAPEELVQAAMFKTYQGPCTIDSECEGGLVCHASSRKCICNASTNEGCNAGQTCGVHPEAYCPQPEGCVPTCTCDYSSDATDGSNGCPVGEVCRTPCAMVDHGPMCFESNEKRDCGDVWPSNYVCADSNGDGVIDRNDYAAGCVEGN